MKPAFKNLASSIRTFQSELTAADAQRRKAAQTAVRIEGYRLAKVLKTEIKAGAPGGHKFKPLGDIARLRGRAGRTPLARLAIPVRYWVQNYGGRYSVSVGYQDRAVMSSAGNTSRNHQLSKSWLAIVRSQISGATFDPGRFDRHTTAWTRSDRTEILTSAFGGRRGKKQLKPGRDKFLLRRSTRTMRIPARPIIDPFWAKHRAEAMANIERNFIAKLAGQKI